MKMIFTETTDRILSYVDLKPGMNVKVLKFDPEYPYAVGKIFRCIGSGNFILRIEVIPYGDMRFGTVFRKECCVYELVD
jgi:hypothetical protein